MGFLGFILLSLVLVPGLVCPTTISSNRKCKDMDILITVTSTNGIYSFPPLTTNEEATDLLFHVAMRDPSPMVASGYVNITGTYNINARFCTPENGNDKSQTVQVLTHGVGFDKSYWDPSVSRTNYSYVDAAIAAGYSTFFYDRIGNGKSSKPDPNNVTQSFLEVAILTELTKLIRTNSLNLDFIKNPPKVIHVGHSYGSVLTNYFVANYPELSDGIILTGYSHNFLYRAPALSTWGFQIAKLQSPQKFKDFTTEYFTWANKWSNQLYCFKYPFFSAEALDYAEDNKQPVSLGVMMSINSGNLLAAEFSGPVFVISGQYDLPLCGGNCTGILEASEKYFPASSSFRAVVHPDAGHSINLHLSANAAYRSILDFLGASGL